VLARYSKYWWSMGRNCVCSNLWMLRTALMSIKLFLRNQDTKTVAYKTLVRPTIEYCSSVWSPHTKDAINKIEMVQRRAARYVTNRYRNTSSVTSMLGDLEWDTLEIRRKKIRLTMMYKIINNLIDIRAEEYLTKPTRQTRSSHSLKYQQFSASTDD
jgi:hypothetical protein